MMSSTFTTFDMTLTQSLSQLSYIYGIIPTLMFLQTFWVVLPTRKHIMTPIYLTMIVLIKTTNNSLVKGSTFILTPTFFCIILLNLWGAAPFTPTLTSHLLLTLSMGMPAWSTLILISLSTKVKQSMAHFLPENSPTFIASFLALVETLSSYIRPITLSFRLSANISAGHVILGMVMSASVYTILSMPFTALMPVVTGTGYTVFEFAICVIQAFVFTLLANMYSNDYVSMKQ